MHIQHSTWAPPDKWLPPPRQFKLNFDGSFNQLSISAGIGVIIRDLLGNMFSAFAGRVKSMHPLEAELLALENGLKSAKDWRFHLLKLSGTTLSWFRLGI